MIAGLAVGSSDRLVCFGRSNGSSSRQGHQEGGWKRGYDGARRDSQGYILIALPALCLLYLFFMLSGTLQDICTFALQFGDGIGGFLEIGRPSLPCT